MAELAGDAEELNRLARRARQGDSAARNELWTLASDMVEAAVEGQRALPRLWELDDLRQEAFVVFAEVVDAWPGEGDVGEYLGRELSRALGNRVRRAWRRQERERSGSLIVELERDPEAEGQLRLAELFEGLSRLPRPAELALWLHLVAGLSLAQVGRQLGLGRRMLEDLVPLARQAVLEGEEERLERLTRELYAFADPWGRVRGTRSEVRARLDLSVREHAELVEELEARGVLTGRRRGNAGRLPIAGPDAAVRLLRRHRPQRSA